MEDPKKNDDADPSSKDDANRSSNNGEKTDREKELEAQLAKAEEDKANLRKGLDEKGKELNQLKEQTQKKADDVISGEKSASDLTEQEIEDLKYMNRLGYVSKKQLEEVLTKVKEETKQEVEASLTKQQKLIQTEKEIDEISARQGNSFIDKEELKNYLSERAKGGTVLSVEEAVTLLYKDKIIAGNVKPKDLPGVVKSDKGKIEGPKPKVLELGSREMSERISERLNSVE